MPTLSWPKRLFAVLGLVFLACLIWLASLQLKRPSNRRLWHIQQAALARPLVKGSLVRIDSLRDFAYTSADQFTPQYIRGQYDLTKLTKVWFVLTPFASSWRGPAHSFVTFGFSDGQYLAVSIEARKEPGEEYGLVTGLTRQFELIYLWGTERDLIGSRAAFAPYPVYLYPINTTPKRIQAVFLDMLARTEHLRTHPEFYNTITNNCTSNLVAHINKVSPRPIPSGLKTILPGYTDEVAFQLGLISPTANASTLASARTYYLINARARQFIHAPDFSARLRAPN